MRNKNISWKQWSRIFLFMFLFIGNLAMAQSHVEPKLQKNGKYKQKKPNIADHHQKAEKKKSHHKADWNHHSKSENDSFSKKKRKKK